MAQVVKNLPTMRETWVRSLGWEDSLERKWQPTPVFLPRKSHGRRSLVQATVYGVTESRARLSDFPFCFLMAYDLLLVRSVTLKSKCAYILIEKQTKL